MRFVLKNQVLEIDNFDLFKITEGQALAYFDSLKAHIAYVTEAGARLGLTLREHDRSKLTIAEFPHYVRQFHGDKADPDGFALAFAHHVHCNAHHWQHWIVPQGFTYPESCLRMPRRYIREMVADWLGASRTYTGSWDMTEWLYKNLGNVKLHPTTWSSLAATLTEIGYDGNGLVYGR